MNSDTRQAERLEAALLRLAGIFEDDRVLLLRVVVTDDPEIEVAAVDRHGVLISRNCLIYDYQNLEVYLAHEIYHDVLPCTSLHHVFPSRVLNAAADYRINFLLKKLHGLDVRKVKFKGLFDPDLGKKRISDIASFLQRSGQFSSSSKFVSKIRHPLVREIAEDLRKRFQIEDVSRAVDLVSIAPFDLPLFNKTLRKNYDTLVVANLPNVDHESVLRSLWARFYYDTPKWEKASVGDYLSNTQVLSAVPKVSGDSFGDSEFSLFAAVSVLKALDTSDAHIARMAKETTRKLDLVVASINHLKREGFTRSIQQRKQYLKARILALRKKRLYLTELPALSSLLATDYQVRAKKSSVVLSGIRRFIGERTRNTQVRYDTQAELVKLVQLVCKSTKSLADTKSIYSEFDNLSKGAGMQSEDTAEDGSGSEEGAEDADTQGAGRGKTSSRVKALTAIQQDPSVFRKILCAALDFGEQLVVKASKMAPDGLLDKTLTLGTDLSKVVQSDLGRMANNFAKLSFFVDLANGNLLQYTDLDARRSPLVLVLDCSGSMQGRCYAVAAGFCFSLITKLTASDRGCALVKFSSGVDHVMIWDTGRKASLNSLLTSLSTPSYGGTDFSAALHTAFEICSKQHWTKSQVLLISDGYDALSDSVLAAKPTDCKLTAVLVSSKQSLDHADECINISTSQLRDTLVSVGNQVL